MRRTSYSSMIWLYSDDHRAKAEVSIMAHYKDGSEESAKYLLVPDGPESGDTPEDWVREALVAVIETL